MLKISRLADYAVIIMCALAERREYASATEMATATKVTKTTVSKILKILARGSLIQAVRGSNGGYALLKQPADISLAAVITAMDGPIALTECNSIKQNCSKLSCCEARPHWQFINKVIAEVLSQYTLEDMLKISPVSKRALTAIAVPLSSVFNIKRVEKHEHRK